MKPEEIKLTDWIRILIGDVPGAFYIELVIRAVFIYLLLTVAMRLLGKRMSSQLGRTELAALVTLAAAIGVPIQAPDRGILPTVVIAIVVIYVGRWIATKAIFDQNFEKKVNGNLSILISNSVLDIGEMKVVRLTRQRLVAQLRNSGIKQLGQVKRLYMEASGSFTLIKEDSPKAGLSIMPHWDEELNSRFKKSNEWMTCQTCGTLKKQPFTMQTKCPNCGDANWTNAVL